MAETSFSKLDPNTPLPQATVNRTGPGWNSGATRDDGVVYHPLTIPIAGAGTPQLTEPAPPAPSEDQLRGALQRAITAKAFSDDQLSRAEGTADRAAAYVAQCRARLASYDGLDDAITAATIAALQSETGKPDPDGELHHQQAAREAARGAVQAAERVARVLVEALTDARADAERAVQAARKAAVGVAAIEAERLAEHVIALEDEAKRTREAVYGFDRIAVAAGQRLPPASRAVVWSGGDDGHTMRRVDSSAWLAAINQLLADATAAVSIEIPEPTPPRPSYSLEVRRAIPIRPQAEPVAEVEGSVISTLDPAED